MSDESSPHPPLVHWRDLVGHQRAIGALRRAVAAGRPHHAYLILGPAGLGKMTLARAMAGALLCESRDDGACGDCPGCSKLRQGMHTAVHSIVPGGRSNTIQVDQIQELQRALSFRRLDGRWRIVLVDDAGSMNETAQNKLLKTLEEPPEGTVLLLCALHPAQMLQTVRSRCQKITLGAVDDARLTEWLTETHGAHAAAAAAAAAGAQGIPGRALELLDPETSAERAERLRGLVAALGGDAEAMDGQIRAVDRDRTGCGDTLVLLQELLRDAMVLASGGAARRIHPDVDGRVGRLAGLAPADYAAWIDRIEVVQEQLTRNVHPGALMEDVLLKITGASA